MGRRHSGPARCRSCDRPVIFLRSPFTSNVRTFDPTELDGRTTSNPNAYPVLGRAAYRVTELAALLQVQRGASLGAVEDEIRDLPWHQLHTCTPDTSTTPDDDTTGGPR